jgi:hypothetical protein
MSSAAESRRSVAYLTRVLPSYPARNPATASISRTTGSPAMTTSTAVVMDMAAVPSVSQATNGPEPKDTTPRSPMPL